MMEIDTKAAVIRAAAILTGSYVAGTVIDDARKYNQLVLYVDFTIGSLTTAEIKVEMARADGTYYQEASESSSVSGGVNTKAISLLIRQLAATGKTRIAIPIADADKIKISVKGTGTVTSSSMAIDAILAKNYA